MTTEQHQAAARRIAELEAELVRLKRSLLARSTTVGAFPIAVLVVQARGIRFAIPVAQIEAVVRMLLVTPLPEAPAAVRGTVHYRRALVPVLDAGCLASAALSALRPDMSLVLVQGHTRRFALAVDAVLGVHAFTERDAEAAVELAAAGSRARAVLRHEGRPLAVVDPAALLAAGELDRLDALLTTAAEPRSDQR